MSDEGLDKMFREGLSKRHVEFNMDAWRRMEEILPPEAKPKGYKFGYAATVVGLLLVASTALFLWSEHDEIPPDERVFTISRTLSNDNREDNMDIRTNFEVIRHSKFTTLTPPDSAALSEKEEVEASMQKANMSRALIHASGKNSKRKMKHRQSGNSTSNAFFTNNSSTHRGFFETVGFDDIRQSELRKEEKVEIVKKGIGKVLAISKLVALPFVKKDEEEILVANVQGDRMPKLNKNGLGIIGGININHSITSSGGVAGSEFLGLEYQRYLKGGLSIKANLLYSARNSVNARKVFDKKFYDFGSRSEQTMIECQRLHYVELPIMLNYGFANHEIMLGSSFAYLLSGIDKVTTVYESQTSGSSIEEKTEWVRPAGFSSYDFSIMAGYEYSVSTELNVGVRLNFGLIDITDNVYFGTDSFDNNTQLRIYVTYKPFHF